MDELGHLEHLALFEHEQALETACLQHRLAEIGLGLQPHVRFESHGVAVGHEPMQGNPLVDDLVEERVEVLHYLLPLEGKAGELDLGVLGEVVKHRVIIAGVEQSQIVLVIFPGHSWLSPWVIASSQPRTTASTLRRAWSSMSNILCIFSA